MNICSFFYFFTFLYHFVSDAFLTNTPNFKPSLIASIFDRRIHLESSALSFMAAGHCIWLYALHLILLLLLNKLMGSIFSPFLTTTGLVNLLFIPAPLLKWKSSLQFFSDLQIYPHWPEKALRRGCFCFSNPLSSTELPWDNLEAKCQANALTSTLTLTLQISVIFIYI